MVVITACSQITQKIGVEENPSVGPRVLCNMNRSVIGALKIQVYTERVDDLEESFSKNLLRWKEEGPETLTRPYGIQ